MEQVWWFLTESSVMKSQWSLIIPIVLVVALFRYAYRKDKR